MIPVAPAHEDGGVSALRADKGRAAARGDQQVLHHQHDAQQATPRAPPSPGVTDEQLICRGNTQSSRTRTRALARAHTLARALSFLEAKDKSEADALQEKNRLLQQIADLEQALQQEKSLPKGGSPEEMARLAGLEERAAAMQRELDEVTLTLNPIPYTRNPTPKTLNPKP